jgi:hypothetical protein
MSDCDDCSIVQITEDIFKVEIVTGNITEVDETIIVTEIQQSTNIAQLNEDTIQTIEVCQQGPPGAQGPQGLQGIQGPPGSSVIVNVITVLGNYTLTPSDHFILCDCSTSAITVTAPNALGYFGQTFKIKKIDGSASNFLTVSSISTIDDSASITLKKKGDSISIVSNDSKWYIY